MHSSSGFLPTEGLHVRQSELCATCHTLYTKALGERGEVIGELPEQVPFLEWRHSAYANERSCQSCHMPVVTEKTRIASVVGEEREGLARHTFLGGNAFMLRMLNRFRAELGVEAAPHELEASARATALQVQTRGRGSLTIDRADDAGAGLTIDMTARNLTGHKLPTAYPSRRAWLHLTVRDRNARAVFESGAVAPSGAIEGNDNDADPLRAEPHYREVTRPDQVQIYESILADSAGGITTGLLKAVGFLQGQPPAAARVRQAHRREGHRGGGRCRRRSATSPTPATGFATSWTSGRPRGRSGSRPNCSSSRLASAGPTT